MAKQVLRKTLGEDKATEFLAEAFGPDGDSDETDAGDGARIPSCLPNRLAVRVSVCPCVLLPQAPPPVHPSILPVLRPVYP